MNAYPIVGMKRFGDARGRCGPARDHAGSAGGGEGQYGYYRESVLHRREWGGAQVRRGDGGIRYGRCPRKEGNVHIEYFQPLDDPETILLIDAWESQEALDVHHASPMMTKIAELRDKYDLHMTAERYRTDEAGLPAHDQAFIRQ